MTADAEKVYEHLAGFLKRATPNWDEYGLYFKDVVEEALSSGEEEIDEITELVEGLNPGDKIVVYRHKEDPTRRSFTVTVKEFS